MCGIRKYKRRKKNTKTIIQAFIYRRRTGAQKYWKGTIANKKRWWILYWHHITMGWFVLCRVWNSVWIRPEIYILFTYSHMYIVLRNLYPPAHLTDYGCGWQSGTGYVLASGLFFVFLIPMRCRANISRNRSQQHSTDIACLSAIAVCIVCIVCTEKPEILV